MFFKSSQVFVIITGASKGFGRSLCLRLAEFYRQQFPPPPPPSSSSLCRDNGHQQQEQQQQITSSNFMFVLIARNDKNLQILEDELKSIDSRLKTIKMILDLSIEGSMVKFEKFLKDIHDSLSNFGHFILIHNAGSIGNPKELCETINVNDSNERNLYYRLNLYSVMEMTGIFLRETKHRSEIPTHIINISSLAAIKPLRGLVDYCIGKAAREAYFKQLANEAPQTYRILNYAPGPLDTEMFHTIKEDGELKELFATIKPLKTEESVNELLRILQGDYYENAQHIDFYDKFGKSN